MVRAKKFLGQHFLKDKTIASKIVDSLDAASGNILEVGSGTGVLTRFLLQRPENLSLVEIDRESIAFLRATYPELRTPESGYDENRKTVLYQDDFLEMELNNLFGNSSFSVIGNFPYNISTQIFFKVIEYKAIIPEVVGMVQKEVAERMIASPGNKTYGILSVLLQRWYNIEYLFTVDENVFIPPPKVKSAVIKMTRNDRQDMQCDENLFIRLVKTTFNQRRKTIRNSIKPLLGDKTYDCDFMNLRPEQLSIEQFIDFTNEIEKIL
ncbi:MAG: 16S rRNA (adenine(1518)-N(6)/adenine(1519)-N(6))-dimethyltransferase RsmA [Prevotellaceae bacterium]|jgi:16S rRNA (adenine1518-N6/adenine1519-N6)-dimethyltransferase|nr:16S rRNA (adenine(1518)-N(6)/adenine(1519)-N(6))-dimethyltransferase RsmA [Prevotellaceae bacterium]